MELQAGISVLSQKIKKAQEETDALNAVQDALVLAAKAEARAAEAQSRADGIELQVTAKTDLLNSLQSQADLKTATLDAQYQAKKSRLEADLKELRESLARAVDQHATLMDNMAASLLAAQTDFAGKSNDLQDQLGALNKQIADAKAIKDQLLSALK